MIKRPLRERKPTSGQGAAEYIELCPCLFKFSSFDQGVRKYSYLSTVKMSQRWRKLATAGLQSNHGFLESEVDLHSLNEVEPELCIKFLRNLSLKTYTSLTEKLKKCSRKWLTEFLMFGGLTTLFEVLQKLSERDLVKFSDAYLQLECVRCIKTVMNNVAGLEFIISRDSTLTTQLVIGE